MFLKIKRQVLFVEKLKAIKNIIKFSHLFIFLLRSYLYKLREPNLDCRLDFLYY